MDKGGWGAAIVYSIKSLQKSVFHEHLCSSENVVNGSDVWLIQSSRVYNRVEPCGEGSERARHTIPRDTQLVHLRKKNSGDRLRPGVPLGSVVGPNIFVVHTYENNRSA